MNTKALVIILSIICLPVFYFFRSSLDAKLFSPFYATNVDAATLAVESSYEPSNPVGTGYTPLMIAAMKGDVATTKKLIADGVPLDMVSEDKDQSTVSSNLFFKNIQGQTLKNTALHIAIYNTNFNNKSFAGDIPVAYLLIDAGANVRMHNNRGDTPMHYIMQRIYNIPQLNDANISERENLMIRLISHGADINAQNNQGYTMLHLAVFNGEAAWIKRLAENYGSITDFSAKAFPVSCKTLTGLQGAWQTKTAQEECKQNLTPLQLSISWTGISSATHTNLIAYKPKILRANERDIMGMTGFMLAVIWEGRQKLKNPAYDASRDFNDPHKDYTVDLLIKEVADLNATVDCVQNPCFPGFNVKNTVLHIALLHQIPDMVSKILNKAQEMKKNIDVNKKNMDGDTPLHYVLKIDHIDKRSPQAHIEMQINAVKTLMDHGANINIQNNKGNTLLHLAVKAHATELVNFIIQKYNIPCIKKPQLVNLSITNNDGLAQGNPVGKTALDLAKELKFTDIADILIKAIPENQKWLSQVKDA